MIWKKITIETTTEAEELVADFLNEQEMGGVVIEDNVPLTEDELSQMYVDIPKPAGEDDGKAFVSFFVKDGFNIDAFKIKIYSELMRLSEFVNVGRGAVYVENTEDDATWQNNWKEFFKPLRIYDDIVILPNWMEWDEIRTRDTVVRIESVMAFGTGTHETTKLCIGEIKNIIKEKSSSDPVSLLDIGCGSGILSIIAAYLGAAPVTGIDIDPQAIASSHENALANGFDVGRIDFSIGNLLDDEYYEDKLTEGKKYDIVVANILADVIIPLCSRVRPFMKEGARFITSGIYYDKETAVREALFKNGFRTVNVITMGEWVSIVAE